MKKSKKQKQTSAAIARIAARLLSDPKTPIKYRAVIASALAQGRGRKT